MVMKQSKDKSVVTLFVLQIQIASVPIEFVLEVEFLSVSSFRNKTNIEEINTLKNYFYFIFKFKILKLRYLFASFFLHLH